MKEDTSGTKPKVQLTDANGVSWTAKFASRSSTGTEVHAEIAATRLIWAFGYFVEEHYFVAKEKIAGVQLRRRTSYAVAPDGTFTAARFERRPSEIVRGGHWDLHGNPFAGSRELSGLKFLVMLLHYEDSDFIRGVVGETLEFCHGLDLSPPLSVPVEHARWLSELASQLSYAQVRRAFEASGAESRDIDGFSTLVMRRFAQLRATIAGTGDGQKEGCNSAFEASVRQRSCASNRQENCAAAGSASLPDSVSSPRFAGPDIS